MLPADIVAKRNAHAPEILRVTVLSAQEASAGALSGGTPLLRVRCEVRVVEVIRSVAGLLPGTTITIDQDVPTGEFTFETLGLSFRRLHEGETTVLFAGPTRYGTYTPLGGGYSILSEWSVGETWPSSADFEASQHPLLEPVTYVAVLLGDP